MNATSLPSKKHKVLYLPPNHLMIMFQKITLIPVLLLLYMVSWAQSFDALNEPNTYQSADNPYYWKNRPPYAGYWQQDVSYKIKANVDETSDIIDGTIELTYWNNSPDTLHYVFFHLYQNAFQPESYLDELNQENHYDAKYGKYEDAKLGEQIQALEQNGNPLRMEYDNTVVKAYLNQALLPNTSTTFHIRFRTFYDNGGNVRRRMKIISDFGSKQYNGALWYPRLAVYDRKFGWTTDQHLGREFYGDFGTFDVELTFSDNYVVEATGNLVNRDEVLPKDLREKLDIKNFANKPWNSKPELVLPYDHEKRKTWHFHAENVHDFAFVASPLFRIGEAEWNGIKTVAVVQEPHAAGWQNAAEYTAKIIKTFSTDFGLYVYPKMIVADAADGMEYPMLTMDGGKDPDYRYLLTHEVGHNWFYGMLGNNETYRAFLDEGFTQFLTAWGMEAIDGEYAVSNPIGNDYVRKFKKNVPVRESAVYYGYISDAMRYQDAALNTHSDDFGGALRHGGGYRHVYYKTATMLYNLQYVLGDELFLQAMQHYVSQWKICHPYPEDFRNSIINYTHVDLNWFFDEWLETTKSIDYSVKKVKRVNDQGTYEITFKRKGSMQMPIDFSVLDKTGNEHKYYIPNTWFVKETEAKVLPKWTGWGPKLNREYTATVQIPNGINEVQIDPTYRLADINLLNNSNRDEVEIRFDSKINNFPNRYKYIINVRPDIWFNAWDGFKLGLHANGNYANYKHFFDATVWWNSGWLAWKANEDKSGNIGSALFPFNARVSYKTPTDKFIRKGMFGVDYRYLDGLEVGNLTFEKDWERPVHTFINLKYMHRVIDNYDYLYPLYPDEWTTNSYNTTLNTGMSYTYSNKKIDGSLALNARTTFLLSNIDYRYVNLEAKNNFKLWRLKLKTRVFAQAGGGSNIPKESSLFYAGANPEEMMENKYVRSMAFYPENWVGAYGDKTNHFQYGGGLNMRGYAGYLLAETDKYGNTITAYRGISGAALNAELEFDGIVKWKPRKLSQIFDFDMYLFGDVGSIVYNNSMNEKEFSTWRTDAGIGAALTLKKFGVLQGIKPITIRFDVPFYLSHAPFTEGKNFAFRYQIGVNRAF